MAKKKSSTTRSRRSSKKKASLRGAVRPKPTADVYASEPSLSVSDNLWFSPPRSTKLIDPYSVDDRDSLPIQPAEAMTIALLSVVVAEDYEAFFRGNNDVLIATRAGIGSQPLVTRLHAFEPEIPVGQPIRNIYADTIFATDDYDASSRVWVELNVIESDRHSKQERDAIITRFQGLAQLAGAVFPAFIPYAFGVAAASDVFGKLLDALERDTPVIAMPVSLYGGETGRGRIRLRPGIYAAFNQPIDPSDYTITTRGQVRPKDGAPSVSYLLFDVRRVAEQHRSIMDSQRAATLLTQLDEGNPNSAKAGLDFLVSTVKGYSNFKKLERYVELSAKDELSAPEIGLLKQIASNTELSKFVPR